MKRNIAWILKSIVKYSIISSLNSILSTVAKWKWNCSVVADSLRPHGLHSPWNSLGQNTGVDSFPFSRGSSQPRDRTQVSLNAGGFFTRWATKEVQEYWSGWQNIVPETMSFYTTIFTKVYFFSPQKIWGRVKFLLVPYCYACGYQFLLVDLFSVIIRISQIYVDASFTPCSLKFFLSSHPVISISGPFTHWQNPIPQLNH